MGAGRERNTRGPTPRPGRFFLIIILNDREPHKRATQFTAGIEKKKKKKGKKREKQEGSK